MARYYCEYCHSYLTHDTLSVRKSHLVGKNHLRITADYYRNKGKGLDCRYFPKGHPNKNFNPPKKDLPALHAPTNKEKKRILRRSRLHRKELDQSLDVLKKIYEGSPGYSKVFVDVNRLDIGDLVRVSRLPQRANAPLSSSSGSVRRRQEIFSESLAHQSSLEPPRVLSQWPQQPTTTFYDPTLQRNVITESRKRIH